jgi:mercuric reductase
VTYNLAIIGSGAAGFAAAIAAAKQGLSVVMIEQATTGGTCVNVGCIPSKALLAAAHNQQVAGEHRFPGIKTDAGPIDMPDLVAGKDEIVSRLRREKYEDLSRDYRWTLLPGRAQFVAGPALDVAGQVIEADHYLIATGATPKLPAIPGLSDTDYLTYTSAMALERLPESLLVIGGNYVGLELGQLFARLGSRVTIIEALDRIAPAEEPELSQVISESLQAEGVDICTGASPAEVHRAGEKVSLRTVDGRQVSAAAVLVATGRRPASDKLGLDQVGVTVAPSGAVVVDEFLRTANPRIWAAGDVTGSPQFVYVAGAQGSTVVDNAFFSAQRRLDYCHLPRVGFTSPNLASVGMTEAEARRAGLECDYRTLAFSAVPRAVVSRDPRGVVKIVAEANTGIVLGIHMAAEAAGDAILAATYALEANMTVEQLASTWAPYLTTAEALKLAAQSFRTDPARLSCCAS